MTADEIIIPKKSYDSITLNVNCIEMSKTQKSIDAEGKIIEKIYSYTIGKNNTIKKKLLNEFESDSNNAGTIVYYKNS